MKRLLSIFLFLVIITTAFGQKPFFQSYTLLKKKQPVKINTLFQDRAGFLWFGTDKGLFRYDGLKYQNYTIANGLPDNVVTAIAQDSLGRLWTGHQSGELAIIDGDVITKFAPPEGHATREVSDIIFDAKGRLWFSTLEDGLYYFQEERLYRLDEVDGMPDLFVHDLAVDARGSIWAATDRGVVTCSFVNNELKLDLLNSTAGLPDNIIRKIIIDSKGTVWMAAEDAGLLSYNPQTKAFTQVIQGWHYGAISDLLISDAEATMAIAQKGLLVYSFHDQKTNLYAAATDQHFASINCLLRDHEGNIWLGCPNHAIRLPGYVLEHIDLTNTSKEENITALAVDKNHDTWYAVNGKLYLKEKDAAGITHTRMYPLNNIKPDSYVSTIYVDPSGNIWIGFFGQGLIKIDHTTHQQHYFAELHDASVLAIFSDSTSTWLATLSGAVQINTTARPSIRYYNKSNGLSTDYIYQVFIDSKKRVWFGTDGKGVDMLDAQSIHHYEQGLHSKVVYGFAEDVNKNIWVNTQGDGLYTFNGSSFVPLSQKNNQLRDNEISCLSTDKFGNLVVMHDLGLDIYDVVRNKVFHIGDELGLDNFKPTLNAVCRDAHGDLFFGTSHGAIHYASRQTRVQTSPTPFIESLKVMDKKIAPGQALSFGYNQNEITINYTGFWYQNAENLHYQYQLEGLDRNKIDSRDAAAIYSDLPPGDYSFHLKVSDADFYGPEETVISFTILPPFWKTPLFYVLVIGVAVLIIYAIIKFRERQLLLEKRELEEKVAERTIEIQKKNEEIQAQTEEIIGINENLENLVRSRTLELEQKNKALEEYAFITAHELRAPLASILGLVNILCKVKLEEQDKMILDHLREASEKLESIVRTITEAIEKGDQIPPSELQE